MSAGEDLQDVVREVLRRLKVIGWSSRRPWGEFANQLKLPTKTVWERVETNLVYYRTNYLLVAAALFAWTIVTSLSVALCVLATGALAAFASTPRAVPLVVSGRAVTPRETLGAAGGIALLLWLLTGALFQALWALSMTVIVIAAHATLRPRNLHAKAAKMGADFQLGFSGASGSGSGSVDEEEGGGVVETVMNFGDRVTEEARSQYEKRREALAGMRARNSPGRAKGD